MVAGIYLIKNKINGHMYVGGSVNIEKRFGEHKRGSNSNTQAIDRAILKYGNENFTYQIITELPADWEIIEEHERYWINFYNTFKNPKHYNLTKGGEGVSGWTPSEETRKRMSESQTGKVLTEETKKKISENMPDMSGEKNNFYGQKHTPEACKQMSEKLSGEKNPRWKSYPRITKAGKIKSGKQQYVIRYDGKVFVKSIYKEKLYKKWYDKYPDIELIDETE